jgi:hypothetical protein
MEIMGIWRGIKLVIKIPELNILNSAAGRFYHFPFKTPLNLLTTIQMNFFSDTLLEKKQFLKINIFQID